MARHVGPRQVGAIFLASLLASTIAAKAQDAVAEFYKGRTISGLIGTVVGGEYDLHARLVFRFIGKHIPGNPQVIAQNMAGGGGVRMANYLYQAVARDGATIGVINNAYPAAQVMGDTSIQFDAGQLQWIGTISPTIETMTVWRTAGVTTIGEARAKEVIVGATGKGSVMYTFPKMLNELLGTRFKIVAGYAGGNDVNIAMERGEVFGRNNTWSSWKSTKPQWLANKDIVVLVQAGPTAKDLPAPNVEELARTDDDRGIMQLISSGAKLGRPLATNQGVPADRVKALRDAFDATMKDPEFRAAAAQAKVDVDPVGGLALQKLVGDVLATPKPLVERAKKIID